MIYKQVKTNDMMKGRPFGDLTVPLQEWVNDNDWMQGVQVE